MEYIRLTFQIALGIIFMGLIFRKSVLYAYFLEWRRSNRRWLTGNNNGPNKL
jgi:hypothetical protein